jgi:plasmid stabilization system protein ParE
MSRYILAPLAQEDLTSIRDYYLEAAGQRIARRILIEFVEAFRTLARNPGLGHKRPDLAGDRPVLFWAVRDYLVLYRAEEKPLEIIMIVRGTRDIPTLIRRRQP